MGVSQRRAQMASRRGSLNCRFQRLGNRRKRSRSRARSGWMDEIPQPLRMSRGSSIIGRLVRNGKPVVGGTVGLKIAGENDFLFPRKLEIRTADRGVFRIDHVPSEMDFWVYGKLGSLTDYGAVVPVSLHSPEDNATVDLGDLRAEEGRTLAGRVVCSDGRTPWQRVHMLLGVPNAVGVLEAKLDEIGRFRIQGDPRGSRPSVRSRGERQSKSGVSTLDQEQVSRTFLSLST